MQGQREQKNGMHGDSFYGLEDGKGRAEWAVAGGAGCPEWVTIPEDICHFTDEAKSLTIALLF